MQDVQKYVGRNIRRIFLQHHEHSAAEAFSVTLELVRRGYSEKDIGKIWSGNLPRVWGEVEKVAKKLQK